MGLWKRAPLAILCEQYVDLYLCSDCCVHSLPTFVFLLNYPLPSASRSVIRNSSSRGLYSIMERSSIRAGEEHC